MKRPLAGYALWLGLLVLAGCSPDVLRPPLAEKTTAPSRLLLVPLTWSQVSAGWYNVCAVSSADGSVGCWGDSSDGSQDIPGALGAAAQVSMGSGQTCAIRSSDRAVLCWGRNDYGQSVVPPDLGAVSQVAAGGTHTCAIRADDGALVCWGDNRWGQSNVPAALGAAAWVQPGGRQTCAIRRSDGALLCWGDNSFGQLDAPAGLGAVRQVAGRNVSTCAIRQSDGTLACWGWNNYGQLNIPPGLGAVSWVTGGNFHFCAVRLGDGSVVCWGRNDDGQSTVPAGLGAVSQVSAGTYHTCALRAADGVVICWGRNLEGETNVPGSRVLPTATFTAPSPVDEGSPILLSLSDAQVPGYEGGPFGYAFDCGDGAGLGPFADAYTQACPTTDDGARAVRGVIRDRDGDIREYGATVSVRNVAPTITALARLGGVLAPVQLVAGSAAVAMQLDFTDPAGPNDTYSASFTCGNGTTQSPSGIVSPATVTCTYTAAGIYTVRATVSDEDGGTSAESAYQYVVVYDPEGAFVTGSGLLEDAAGGSAHTAFNARFLPGRTTAPEGSARFWIPGQAARFESTGLDMLVVSGNRAQLWGPGTWNGAAGAHMRLTAVDGQAPGGDGSVDAVRVEIWDALGMLVWDTQPGAPQDAPVTTPIRAGNIRIH